MLIRVKRRARSPTSFSKGAGCGTGRGEDREQLSAFARASGGELRRVLLGCLVIDDLQPSPGGLRRTSSTGVSSPSRTDSASQHRREIDVSGSPPVLFGNQIAFEACR